MVSQDKFEQIENGEITEIYHKVYGKGKITAVRKDKLENGRLKATIEFTIPDLFEPQVKPEFLFLDDENLSLEEWQ
jgi:hypothetical protein